MKINCLIISLCVIAVSILTVSCKKGIGYDDKNKIDIKGSMTNGDMRSSDIEAKYEDRTVWVWFYDDFGPCTVSITSRDGSLVALDTIETYPDASWRFYMGGQPLNRYHLVISNGTDEAEGWFNTFRIVAVRPYNVSPQ